jgi:hypothetical protein
MYDSRVASARQSLSVSLFRKPYWVSVADVYTRSSRVFDRLRQVGIDNTFLSISIRASFSQCRSSNVYLEQCVAKSCTETTDRGHFLRARVIVHNYLLDLEHRILLGRASGPSLVAIPIKLVSITDIIKRLSATKRELTTSCSTSSAHPSQSARLS